MSFQHWDLLGVKRSLGLGTMCHGFSCHENKAEDHHALGDLQSARAPYQAIGVTMLFHIHQLFRLLVSADPIGLQVSESNRPGVDRRRLACLGDQRPNNPILTTTTTAEVQFMGKGAFRSALIKRPQFLSMRKMSTHSTAHSSSTAGLGARFRLEA